MNEFAHFCLISEFYAQNFIILPLIYFCPPFSTCVPGHHHRHGGFCARESVQPFAVHFPVRPVVVAHRSLSLSSTIRCYQKHSRAPWHVLALDHSGGEILLLIKTPDRTGKPLSLIGEGPGGWSVPLNSSKFLPKFPLIMSYNSLIKAPITLINSPFIGHLLVADLFHLPREHDWFYIHSGKRNQHINPDMGRGRG